MPLAGASPVIANDEQLRAALQQIAEAKRASQASALGDTLAGIEATSFEAGEILFRQGNPVLRIYILLSGRVEEVRALDAAAIDDLQALQIREATPVSALGLYELVGRQAHATTARTRTGCKALVIEAAQAYRLFYSDPSLRAAVAPLALINRLRTMPLLAAVDGVTISHLADAVQVRRLEAGESIYQAGDVAATLYLIDQGQVLLEHEDGRRMWLGNGMEFGFGDRLPSSQEHSYALDHNASAACALTLYCVPVQVYTLLTGIVPEAAGLALRKARVEAVAGTGVFHTLTDDERAHLLGFMSHAHMPRRHLLTQQGEVADSLWILLKEQQAMVSAVGASGEALPPTRIQGPAYFNFEALSRQVHAAATLEAEAGSSWLRLHWTDFRAFLEQSGRAEVAGRLAQAQADKEAANVSPKLYAWQQEGERILQESRRHWVAAMSRLMPGLFLTVFSGWLTLGAMRWSDGAYVLGTSALWAFVIGVSWTLTLLFYVWGIADYRNDYLIVTNLRVVHQEKLFLIREKRRIAPLERVQDVALDRRFWANLLGYADLTVQTAGTEGSIRFDRAAQFEEIATAIRKQGAERKRHYQATGRAEIQIALEKRMGRALALPSRVWSRDRGTRPAASQPSPSRLALWILRVGGRGSAAPAEEAQSAQQAPTNRERHVWHKHWLILFRSLFLPAFFVVLALVVSGGAWIAGIESAVARNGLIAVGVFTGLIALFFLWYQWENWRNDIYILESDTLIDIERKPLAMQSDERRAPLTQIVDLQLRVPTPLHYLFNFGTVLAQTAATGSVFSFRNVARPGEVMELIRRRMDEVQRDEERRHSMQRAQEFPEWLDVYGRLASDSDAAEP